MIRVLFFIDRYFPTDHAFIEEVYSKILPRRGHEVTIVARSKTVRRIETCRWNQADVVLLPSKRKYVSDCLILWQIRALLNGDYDIIQVRNDPVFALLAPRGKFIFQLSHLKAEQFISEPKKRFSQLLKGKFDLLLRSIYLPKARYVFAISDAMETFLASKYAINNSTVVPLGVSPVDFDHPRIQFIREKYKLIGKTAFIYIGTMAASRRLEIVLEGFVKASKKTNGALSLLFLGDAPHVQDVVQLKQQAKGESAPNIHFIERVPRFDVPNFIAACDVGLATTPVNAVNLCMSPTKTVEYLNSGIPVLATGIPDQVKIVKKSNSGFFCEFSVEDIARKMIDFHGCRNRKSMGARGQYFVRQTRTYRQIADIVASCYQGVLKSSDKR